MVPLCNDVFPKRYSPEMLVFLASEPMWAYERLGCQEFKSREVAQRQKNSVIRGFIRNLVLNTLLFIDASTTRRLEW